MKSCFSATCCSTNDAGIALSCKDQWCQRVDCRAYSDPCSATTPPCCETVPGQSVEGRRCYRGACYPCLRPGAVCKDDSNTFPCCDGTRCPATTAGGFAVCP
jgi:hypothetical protein